MKVVSVSDKGLVRTNNEDCLSVFSVGKDECFVIADGMGGHAAGELASKTAVEYVIQSLNDYLFEADDAQKLQKLLAFTLEKANVKVYLASLSSFRYRGMGTTLTVAVLRGKTLYISHIGDCRAYLLHGQKMRTLTTDHTLVQRMVDKGMITKEEARNHPKRHVLLRSLGVNEYVKPDTFSVEISNGDVILLCSDGLYSCVEDKTIRAVLRKHKDLNYCLQLLKDLAEAAGAPDNISMIVAEYESRKGKEKT
ncbi:MAG: Stp1/IreP family PP2C-type Ser/Thr phosphatase [Clostridiales bacterium]|jgi:protein phosphatase|nr:Stp1/IreP family PP2C-type Ser/Thr phosphatase [Clostridiales bacterium]MBR6254927.1 Stp1/IreP family PP2C-type Ser/Thr phosphatase [Clostridiales bacterium]MCR5274411.1 Stp1/IreP family PP2C-type Ser/Thr phosphatase [Clostridiales bacterium]